MVGLAGVWFGGQGAEQVCVQEPRRVSDQARGGDLQEPPVQVRFLAV